MNAPGATPSRSDAPRLVAVWRGAALFLLWVVLMQSAKAGDLAVGAFAAAAATWISLRLLPPMAGRLHFGQLLLLLPHFAWESLRAGVDVARRALAPSVRLQPGFVRCPLDFPPGPARNTFATITSLMPGAVPVGQDEGALEYHALDTSQPVVEQLWKEERLFARALVAGRGHG